MSNFETTKATPCGCRERIEEGLLAKFIENTPEATKHEVLLQGYALVIDADCNVKSIPCMPIALTASYPLKNSDQRKVKTTKQKMVFSFCPFCGVNLKDNAK